MNTNLQWRLVIFAFLLLLVLPASFAIYKSRYSFPSYNPSSKGVISNPWVLSNKLPESVVTIAEKQVEKYSDSNNGYSSYTILSKVEVVDDKYTFTLGSGTGKGSLKVGLLVNDTFGILSVQTYINDQLQTLAEDNL